MLVKKTLKPITPASEPFPDYDDWIEELGDWQDPLHDFLKKNVMRDIYEYVTEEYKKETVSSDFRLDISAPRSDLQCVQKSDLG